MDIREISLERISLELFGEMAWTTDVDCDHPLVAIEEEGKFLPWQNPVGFYQAETDMT